MKTITLLKKARGLIEAGWCQGTLARNKYRHAVNYTSKSADRFCVYGALYRASGVKIGAETTNELEAAVGYLKQSLPEGFDAGWMKQLDIFNDAKGTKAKDVVGLYNRAIRDAKADEKV